MQQVGAPAGAPTLELGTQLPSGHSNVFLGQPSFFFLRFFFFFFLPASLEAPGSSGSRLPSPPPSAQSARRRGSEVPTRRVRSSKPGASTRPSHLFSWHSCCMTHAMASPLVHATGCVAQAALVLARQGSDVSLAARRGVCCARGGHDAGLPAAPCRRRATRVQRALERPASGVGQATPMPESGTPHACQEWGLAASAMT